MPDANTGFLGRVALITGPEEFLAERAVAVVRDSVRSVDPEAEFSETTGDRLTLAELGELSAPSLFSSTRCVVVRRLDQIPDESVADLVGYAENPAAEVALVLVHPGGPKGSGTLTKLRKLAAVTETKVEALKPRDLPGFVVNELRSHRKRIDAQAGSFLIQAVGNDPRALAAACDQLSGDVEGSQIDLELVKQYFGGRAEVKSYEVADFVIEGKAAQALEAMRWSLERGTAPVLLTSALAQSLRQLGRIKGAGRGSDRDLISVVGAPEWKVRTLRQQARGWDSDRLGRAIQLVASTDADVKGQSADAAYSLERMVLGVTALRG